MVSDLAWLDDWPNDRLAIDHHGLDESHLRRALLT